MSKEWVKINDNNVLNVWVPTCDGECEQEAVEVSPDFYAENGTPICMCGCDMEYSHTIVKGAELSEAQKTAVRCAIADLEGTIDCMEYADVVDHKDACADTLDDLRTAFPDAL